MKTTNELMLAVSVELTELSRKLHALSKDNIEAVQKGGLQSIESSARCGSAQAYDTARFEVLSALVRLQNTFLMEAAKE